LNIRKLKSLVDENNELGAQRIALMILITQTPSGVTDEVQGYLIPTKQNRP